MSLYASHLRDRGWRFRFLCLENGPEYSDDLSKKYANRLGLKEEEIEYSINANSGVCVPIGRSDVFLGSLWSSFYSVLPLMKFQSEISRGNRNAYVSLIQDYEAGFYPFSSAYLLATSMYDSEWPKVSIFNSSELARYYAHQGHDVSRSETFEPIMNRTLRDFCLERESVAKERRILFYGRPDSLRNCYFLARSALELWSEKYTQSEKWQVISVGEPHRPFLLPNGKSIDVLGKLTLPDYASELSKAAVGLSLMASPHPSYPPLEMAHFDAMVVTNSFKCKDLSNWHENITSVEHAEPEAIADAIVVACTAFDANLNAGRKGKSLKPHYLNDFDSSSLQRMAKLVESCID